MAKKEKILHTAEKHLLNQRFNQALHEYRKLLKLEPNDASLLNTIGDLLLLDGRTEESLEFFRRVSGMFQGRGISLKSIAMLRKILRIDPEDLDSRDTLATLFQKQGLFFEAGRELRFLADHYDSREDWDRLHLCLRRLTEVEPEEAGLWERLGKILAREGRAEEAIEHFLKAIRLHEAHGEMERVYDLAYGALGADNCHRDVLYSYVRAADSLGRLAHAEKFLREQIQLTGDEFPYQMFLAWIAEKQGDLESAGRLYSNLQSQGHQDSLIAEGLIRTGWIEDDLSAALLETRSPDSDDLSNGLTNSVEGGFSESGELFDDAEVLRLSSPEAGSGLFLEEAPGTEGVFAVDTSGSQAEDVEEEDLFAESTDSLELLDERNPFLEESLEEVDFYLKLGFQDDSRRLLRSLLEQFPGDERVIRRAGRVFSPSEIPVLESAQSEQTEDRLVDFDREVETALEGLFSGEPGEVGPGEALRYDVTGHQVTGSQGNGGQNPELHYDLGLAYKEMGLIEDAVREFLTANELARESSHVPQQILCSSMLATSYFDMGDYDESVRWAEAGLSLPDAKEFEWKALKYDLAMALEKKRSPKKAREVYEEILQHDPDYRDVGDRLEGLRETTQE